MRAVRARASTSHPASEGRIHTLTIDTDKVSVFLADFGVPAAAPDRDAPSR